jgi:hypothetical protein
MLSFSFLFFSLSLFEEAPCSHDESEELCLASRQESFFLVSIPESQGS